MANILIVEDEKKMQEIIAEYMQRGGHTCFTADDGMDALLALKNHPMDLMILDIMMPHLDGFSVCRMAREISSLPIIMLTAKSNEDDKLKGYDLGADDYMTGKNKRPAAPFFCLSGKYCKHRKRCLRGKYFYPSVCPQGFSGGGGDYPDPQGI